MSDIQDDIEVNVEGNAEEKLKTIEKQFESLTKNIDKTSESLKKFETIDLSNVLNQISGIDTALKNLKNSAGSANVVKNLASAARTNANANIINANTSAQKLEYKKSSDEVRFNRDFKNLEIEEEKLNEAKLRRSNEEFEMLARVEANEKKIQLQRERIQAEQLESLRKYEQTEKSINQKREAAQQQYKVNTAKNETNRIKANAKQLDAQTRMTTAAYKEYLKESEKALKDSKTELNKARKEALKYGGDRRYTNDFEGGLASILSNANSRMMNRGGIIGGLARLGTRTSAGGLLGGVLKGGTAGGLGVNVGGLALGGFAMALAGAVKGVEKFRDATINAYGAMEKIAVNLEVVMGSKVQSDKVFSDIKNYAVTSPFGVQQTAEMAVLLKQSGVSASELQETLEMIGDVSSGNEEKMKRIANNYAQIQAIGHASMLDMRQFAYAGLPIYEEVAKYMKVTQTELRSMISNGEVTSEVIEAVFKNMTGEGGSFYKAVNKGSKTYAAREMNLEDKKNIALSNWGEYFWNDGDRQSIRSWWMELKEGFWEAVGNIGKDWAVDNNYEYALSSDSYLRDLKNQYYQALRENNTEQAEKIGRSINNFRNSVMSEDEITSRRIEKFNKDNNIKNIVPDSYKKNLDDEIKSILSFENFKGWLGYTKGLSGENSSEDIRNYKFALEKYLEEGEEYYLSQFDLTKSQRDYVASLGKEINNTTSLSEYRSKLLQSSLSDDKEIVRNALAIMQGNIQDFSQSGIDAMNKLTGSSGSLRSKIAKYNLQYENTSAGQQERKEREEKEYNDAKSLFEKMQSYYDYDKKQIKSNLTKEQVEELFNSGFFSATEIKYNVDDYRKGNPDSAKNVKALSKRMVQASNLLLSIGEFTEAEKLNRYSALDKKMSLDTFTQNMDEIVARGNKYAVGDIRRAIYASIFQDLEAPTEFAKNPFIEEEKKSRTKEKEDFVPLWKRIISNTTGWSTDFISTGSGFINDYNKYTNKQIASGGIRGLVDSGISFENLLSRLEYGDKNKQGVRQIDWDKSMSKLLKEDTNGKNVKENANVLQGMSQAVDTQLETLRNLKVSMLTTGEDWSTISNDMKEQYKTAQGLGKQNVFDNAFGFINNNSDTYDVKFDDDGVLSVFNKDGTLVNSVENLKNSTEVLPEKLKSVVDSITQDTIIKPLDKLYSGLEALGDVISASNAVVQESNKLQQQAAQSRIKTLGGTQGTLGGIYRLLENPDQKVIRNLKYFPDDEESNKEFARYVYRNDDSPEFQKILSLYSKKLYEQQEEIWEDTAKNEFQKRGAEEGAKNWKTYYPDEDFRNDAKKFFDFNTLGSMKLGDRFDILTNFFAESRGPLSPNGLDFSSAVIEGNKIALQDEMFDLKPALNQRAEDLLLESVSNIMQTVSELNLKDFTEAEKYFNENYSETYNNEKGGKQFTAEDFNALKEFNTKLKDGTATFDDVEKLFAIFGTSLQTLTDSASEAADALEKAEYAQSASDLYRKFSSEDMFYTKAGNSILTQGMMNYFGLGNMNFSKLSSSLTEQAISNPSRYSDLSFKYQKAAKESIENSYGESYRESYRNKVRQSEGFEKLSEAEQLKKLNEADKEADKAKEEKLSQLSEAFKKGDYNTIKELVTDFDDLSDGINKSSLALLSMQEQFVELGKNIGSALKQFTADAITSSASTLGEAFATGADASSALQENFRQLGSSLASNLGSMMVQAGLSMIISAGDDKTQLAAGLALAAAGGGLSFLSGYLGASSDEEEDDSDYERLLRIKEDLTDLLKQAREDAVYYETHTRHGNALSTNSSIGKTTSVNDAIITPSGNVISTHPDDYLIATKTPETLIGGSGSPTINFSVVDKSTGIKVTHQNVNYDQETNSIDFEAVIESKVNEIIAGSKGDEAFSIRAARQNGVTYIG